MPADQWHGLIDLPTDVLLRTTDHQGAQLAQLHDLWGEWVETLPLRVDLAPYIFNAGWDAADDFNATVFVTAQREADGTLSSSRVVVGNNGVIPPM